MAPLLLGQRVTIHPLQDITVIISVCISIYYSIKINLGFSVQVKHRRRVELLKYGCVRLGGSEAMMYCIEVC